MKSMMSQLHFALSINIVALKLENLVLVKVGRFWVKMTQILDFGIFGVWHQKVKIHQLWRARDFRVLGLRYWFRVQNEAEKPYFSLCKNLGPVEISTGNRVQGRNLWIRPKIADFEGNSAESSGVLLVEISTIISDKISIFTGKKSCHLDPPLRF